jgi:outer membrane protein assembly factor BamD (BamD/ComL family)
MTKTPLWLGLALAACLLFATGVAPVYAQETIRPEVIVPLQQAQELNKQNKHVEALARFSALDALTIANPLEVFTIERLRAVVHMAAGDSAAAGKALEKALQTERGALADRLVLMEHLVLIQYRAKNYADAANWAQRYLTLGGQREQFRQLQGQALYLSGQLQPAVDILQPRLAAELAAGRVPEEVDIRLLASALHQLKNMLAYVSTLETLVRYYPKPQVWAELLLRITQRKDFPAYLDLDLRRLMQHTGAVMNMVDALEHAQLAISAGYPSEARKVLELAKLSTSADGPEEVIKFNAMLAEASRLKQEDDKLLPQLDAQLAKAKDGNPLVNMGLNLALGGQASRGAALIAQGIEKGGLRQPQAARLRLAYAHYLAEQKEQARDVFQMLNGNTAEALLARLWLLHLQSKS